MEDLAESAHRVASVVLFGGDALRLSVVSRMS